jgi:hypothetical protein
MKADPCVFETLGAKREASMNRSVAEMRNLGPATARMLAEVDIADEETLRAVGALAAYRRLKFRSADMSRSLRSMPWRRPCAIVTGGRLMPARGKNWRRPPVSSVKN